MRDNKNKFLGYMMPFYTHVPDDFFDEELKDLSGSEVKVMLTIFRKTFGFKTDKNKISIRYIEFYSGLSRPAVVTALQTLEKKGHIEIKRKKSDKTKRFLTSEIAVRFVKVDQQTAKNYWEKRKKNLAQKLGIQDKPNGKKSKIKPKSQPSLTLIR